MGAGVVMRRELVVVPEDFLMEGKAKASAREAMKAMAGRMKVRTMRRMPSVTLFFAMPMMERTSAAIPSGAAMMEPRKGPRKKRDREQTARQIQPWARENFGCAWVCSMVRRGE